MTLIYLTTKEAAARIRVSENTVRRRIEAKELGYTDIGVPGRPRIRISEDDLEAFMQRNARPGNAA